VRARDLLVKEQLLRSTIENCFLMQRLLHNAPQRLIKEDEMAAALQINFALWGMIICAGFKLAALA
jgi:hypothetical protein